MEGVPVRSREYRGFEQGRLDRLAAEQDGIVTLAQLGALGLGKDAVHHRARSGRLHRVHRGVYAVGRPEVTARGRFRAAVFAVAGSRLAYRSAAALWGFMPEAEEPVDVLVVGARRSPAGIRAHSTTRLPARDVQRRFGIPVTEPHRTLLDLADVLPRRELRRALGQAEVMRLVAHPRLRELLADAHGRHGAHTLSSLLDRGPAPTRSPLEDDLVDFCHEHDLGPRRHNARVAGFEVDVLFSEARLILEADSPTYHDTPTMRANDAEKDRALRAAGYLVLRLRAHDLHQGTAERIRSLLLSRARPSGAPLC
jgi:very-short-patch-repair endonuclease